MKILFNIKARTVEPYSSPKRHERLVEILHGNSGFATCVPGL